MQLAVSLQVFPCENICVVIFMAVKSLDGRWLVVEEHPCLFSQQRPSVFVIRSPDAFSVIIEIAMWIDGFAKVEGYSGVDAGST